MTAADILAKMNVLDNELDISSGGADETRALAAADMAQDAFEAIIASMEDTLGTVGTIVTVANTETTAWPSDLLRLDDAYLMSPDDTTKQSWKIDIIQAVGGQAPNVAWPFSLAIAGTGTGAPSAAYTNRAYFYWAPLPDRAYTVRIYGLRSKTDLTTRAITFGYPDVVANPLAAVAVQLMEMGVDDPSEELERLAGKFYKPVLKMLTKPVRQRAQSRQYSQMHYT